MQADAKQIVVVDDDERLRRLIIEYLQKEGFSVQGVEDGKALDAYLADSRADLIILDLMLPGEDGLSIARRLRVAGNMPILILSAKGEDIDRIVGLEVGADDYLAKPFNPRELSARVKAILRRTESHPEPEPVDTGEYCFGNFTVNRLTQNLRYRDRDIGLTSGEFALLEAFIDHPNRILSRDQLITELKGYDRSPYDRSIDVRVTRLRKKLESAGEGVPEYIRTVWGKGYLFAPKGHGTD